MLLSQIYHLTLKARELTRPMCFNLSRDARAAIACRSRPMCFPLHALNVAPEVIGDARVSHDARELCIYEM